MQNLENFFVYAILLAIIALPSALAIAFYFTRIRKRKPAYYTKKTKSILQQYAVIRNYKVLNHLKLEVNGKTASIDHLLIGFFGLLVVTPMKERGYYYGDARSPLWTFEESDPKKGQNPQKRQFPNPVLRGQEDIDVIRTLFSKNNLYNVNMEHLIVFDSYAKKSAMYMRGNVNVLPLNKLKGYLQSTKFDKDRDLDVPAVYDLLVKNAKSYE